MRSSGEVLALQSDVPRLPPVEHRRLPVDDCLYALQVTISPLRRPSLHRCRQRHGISRWPDVEGDKRDQEEVSVKEATVERYHDEDHSQLERDRAAVIDGYTFARDPRDPRDPQGLTPYGFIREQWTAEPKRFIFSSLQ